MPTREEMNRAVAEARAETEERARATVKRARQMRQAGLIDRYTEDRMIRSAAYVPPPPLDPVQFPHNNRLKIGG